MPSANVPTESTYVTVAVISGIDPSTARICNWLPKPGTGAGASAPLGLLRRPDRITPATLARKSIDEKASPSLGGRPRPSAK